MSVFKDGRHKKTIATRRLRFWEARNVKKVGALMGAYMVSVEEKVVVMNRQIVNSIYFPISSLTDLFLIELFMRAVRPNSSFNFGS